MSERARNLIIVGLVTVMGAVLAVLVATNPSDVDRVEAIGERIRCPVCQGESIANSPAPMARDMMSLVAERVAAGESDQEIVDELLASYSGAVLLDPPAAGATLALWLAPLAALVIGALVILQWRRRPLRDGLSEPVTERRPRRLVPLLMLGVAFAATVAVAGLMLQEGTGPAAGVADLGDQDLDEVSNETMEAVITANSNHPEVDGMRLALAERYFEVGELRSAFPHYLAVAESPNATDRQAVAALVRLASMAWEGNGEAETAIGLLDQALEIDPEASTALYVKGTILWCEMGRADEAARIFEDVLTAPDLPAESRARVEADLVAIEAGEGCL